MARSVFVAGANGFVGSHLCRELIDAGHRVTGFGQKMEVDLLGDIAARMRFIEGSVENTEDLSAAFEAANPDVVVWSVGHNADAAGLAATGEKESARAVAVNAGGLFNTLHAAQVHGVKRAIIAGSAVVFGPAHLFADALVDESAPLRPTTAYGLSKAMGEQIAQYFRERYAMEVSTLRLAVVFGPGRWYGGVVSQLNRLFDQARPGARVDCRAPSEVFDLVYAKDVAQAVRLSVEHGGALQPIYHVNSFAASYPMIIEALQRLVPGFEVRYQALPAPLVLPLMRFDLIQRELGFRPSSDIGAALCACLAQQRQAH
jgi:UDP-glucose 4-epimerase